MGEEGNGVGVGREVEVIGRQSICFFGDVSNGKSNSKTDGISKHMFNGIWTAMSNSRLNGIPACRMSTNSRIDGDSSATKKFEYFFRM